jgi:hypothetical protein
MIHTFGNKLHNAHGLGQKAKQVAKKTGKVAAGAVLGGASALLLSGGASQALTASRDAMKAAQRVRSSLKP